MLGLTHLGLVHTAISLVALAAGIQCLVRDREISRRTGAGRVYVITTVLTCLTGFGIYQQGGFGAPHILGLVTLAVLGAAGWAEAKGKRRLETVAYSATFFFHWIPAVTETTTRLPAGAPLITNREGPELQAITAGLLVLFLVGVTLQLRRLRRLSVG